MTEIFDKEPLAFFVGAILGGAITHLIWWLRTKISMTSDECMEELRVDIKEIKKEVKNGKQSSL